MPHFFPFYVRTQRFGAFKLLLDYTEMTVGVDGTRYDHSIDMFIAQYVHFLIFVVLIVCMVFYYC